MIRSFAIAHSQMLPRGPKQRYSRPSTRFSSNVMKTEKLLGSTAAMEITAEVITPLSQEPGRGSRASRLWFVSKTLFVEHVVHSGGTPRPLSLIGGS
jgi:hypothetical protein